MMVYVDTRAGMAEDGWSAAWTFELAHWGACGQGPDDAAAVADLAARCGLAAGELDVVERVDRAETGDETVFDRDRAPASEAERAATLAILGGARARTLALVRSAPAAVLAYQDPARTLPTYASWHTVGQLAMHLADTESRYYLPLLGLPTRPRAGDLVTELEESGVHVRREVARMAPDLTATWDEHGSWTSVKVLRRLAWHEHGELDVLNRLVQQATADNRR
ncbi:hypothetical protein [Promicromonospora sp. NPDC019610]|uniref:hypothetical protein n=1 Tax=Promicromonospora sp. NPDC019610 TaxID=3364405 RepID=UPI0037A7F039